MLPRVFCCALTALVLWMPALRAQSAPKGSTASSTTTIRYAVSYRSTGSLDWTQYRTYATSADANAVARNLADKGFEVQILARFTLTKVPPRPATGTLPASETVSYQQAVQIFNWLATQGDIAFRFPIDGCYARAHLMIRRMQKRGFKPYKVWTFANGDEQLRVRTANHPRGYVEWKYHVAPIVRVQTANGQRWYVIDPALFKSPVSITQWKTAQKRPGARYDPYVTLTRLGQAPKDPKGERMAGTGYWPGRDPRNVDRHAVSVMKLYKPYEGRIPPASVAEQFKKLALNLYLPIQDRDVITRRRFALAA